jgi:hypothetical protein
MLGDGSLTPRRSFIIVATFEQRGGPQVSRALDPRFTSPPLAMRAIVAASSIGLSPAKSGEITKTGDAATSAAQSFASKSEAEAFLARALLAATAANPKYRSPGSDVDTRWLTKTVEFKDNESGGLVVSTDESVEDYRNGALSAQRTHEAAFAIDEVAISEETTDDLTETGDKARGVLFKCVGAPCIEAVWSGEKSTSAWTDVYVQDDTQRRQILRAFRAPQRTKAGP